MRTKFSGFLTLLLAFVVQLSFAQQKTISGTVTDDTGMPLPGVNILVKGTNTGTQSDFDGNYSIDASVGQTLVFSYIGFQSSEKQVTASTSEISFQMVAGDQLDEVVITGYSNLNRTVQTSAVVSISSEEISQMTPTTSIDKRLHGKAAGVQVTAAKGKPGQGAFVRMRGMGSLVAGAASPLYIVDGAPVREQEIGNIPNEDVENIEILKDAATTARYGSRGANGVVIITTKTGKRNKEGQIRFSSRYGVTSRIKPNFTMMNASQKLQYEAEMYALGVTAASSLPGVTTAPGSAERQFLLTHAVDWQDLILREGVVQSNDVSFSGGSEGMDYYFSVGHNRNTGIIDKIDGFERLSSRLNVNFDVKEWMSIGVNVGYSRSTSDEPRDRNNTQNPFRGMLDYNAYEPEFLLNDDGSIVMDENGDPVYNPTHTTFPIRGALETEPNLLIDNVTIASVNTNIRLSDNFDYGFNVSVSHLNQTEESYSQPGGILQNLIGDDENPGNKFDRSAHRLDLTLSNRLNYNLRKGDHNLNVLGLFEYNMNEFNNLFVRSIGFPSALLTTQINAAEVNDGYTQRNRLTLVSYGAFVDYSYKNRYFASVSLRTDGSSNFGADYKFGTFYSGSLAWDIAEEEFFDVDVIDKLKLRGSYGTTGNRLGIGRYGALGTVSYAGTYPGGPATSPDNIANPNLKWETTHALNVGMELNMFSNRVRGVVDYFKRNTTDLLFNIPVAFESGVPGASIPGNLGEIENSGLEISLQGDVFKGDDFTWTLGGNMVLLDHKIVELPDGEDIAPNTFGILWREGEMINQHYYVPYAGVDPQTGQPLFVGIDDNIYTAQGLVDEFPEETEHRRLNGRSTIADVEGGFFTNFNYKGFGLRADFVFKAGNWIYNAVREQRTTDGLTIADNHSVEAFNYWQKPGDTNVQPSPIYRNDLSQVIHDRFLEKGDYIRMRNVVLSYTFPKSKLENTPISSLRIFAQGQNLLTFTKFWGDPEVGISSGETISYAATVAPGEATLYSYPNLKSIQIGVDVSF